MSRRLSHGIEEFLRGTDLAAALAGGDDVGVALPWRSSMFVLALLLVSAAVIGWGTGQWLLAGMAAAVMGASASIAIMLMVVERQRTATPPDRGLLLAAIDASSDAIAISDAAGTMICANARYGRVCGAFISPLRLAAESADAERLAAMAAAAAAGDSGESTFVRVVDGEAQPLSIAVRRARHANSYLIWRVEKMTPTAVVDRVAALCQGLVDGWLERADLGLLLVDEAGVARFASRTLHQWAGDSETEPLQGRHVDAILAERAGTAAILRVADGGDIPVTVFDSPVGVAGTGASAGVAHVVRRADRAGVGDDDSRLSRQLFAEAPVGMAVVDAKGKLLRINSPMRKFLGLGKDDAEANILPLVGDDERAQVAELIAEAAAGTARRKRLEVRFTAALDALVQLHVRPVQASPGQVVLYLSDNAEQKRLELQFVQAQKMQAVGQLAGGIAHDFNNILTAIIGFCDLLLARHGAGDASFADIMQVKQNANRAANLVRQLLAFSRQQTLRPTVLMVTDVLAELSHLLRRLIGDNISLRLVHGRDIGAIRGDQGQLEQVIINLAVNARDAMPDGGELTISTRRVSAGEVAGLGHEFMPAQDYVAIAVADTGTGIAPDILAKIFEPFFTTKEVGKGTGLGLSTVYGIIKQTDGFIFADSTPGEGTVFTIYLPVHELVAEAVVRPVRRTEEVADLWGHGTILLVEDEDAVRTFAQRALTKKGYNVIEASSGEMAIDIVQRHEGVIDLVISDVMMPNMDGLTLVKALREMRPEVKVIFISGYAQDAFRNKVDDADFNFLPKPFSLTQLAEAVKAVATSP